MSELNPKTEHLEFLGRFGATAITVGVPLATYLLYFGCSEETGGCPPPLALDRLTLALEDVPGILASLWDTKSTLQYLAWYAFCVVAWRILPGDEVEGVLLRNGERKKYTLNAFSTYILALGLVGGYIHQNGVQSFTFLYDQWVGFTTAAFLMSVVQAAYVYAASFRQGKLLALGGNSGSWIYDFFIGRELNPSIGSFDIKSFNELRPGLILWVLIDISMLCEQAVRRGGLVNVTASMWLTVVFHFIYVTDAQWNEAAIFTTMDITTDGFGFMLATGDLLWVPFTYSLQARYLVFNQVELPWWGVAAVIAVEVAGFVIFRQANNQKNNFRSGKPSNLKFMTTKSGSKLITSGWWGRSRHPNYFGDLLMGLAWSLPTGFNTPITYFYPIYFAGLLWHRRIRDDEACEAKYGEDWETYKKLVPYKIIPYVY
ncbi:ERG4/ERG24 ergosterol biosynthesis protein [Cylindrobasidium torrendii FP15055 ss-10]|uniref:Delta(14)-sterol reductase ERG24 n=1 Tax=Cylindrobasidium torrendii FP15055 ss-10 TaxID=1314674 RepID=A0A0D7AT03_9AGAR|nr:ERG4/ERG24 ergosterol biosynthesis protein [Cylindrobasidium torrendii FP15055 ss-10]